MPNYALLRGLPNTFFAVLKDGLHAERHFKNTILSMVFPEILHLLGIRIICVSNAEQALNSCIARRLLQSSERPSEIVCLLLSISYSSTSVVEKVVDY